MENLRSFALYAIFSRSLDGRDSIDYYERSVIWSDFQALVPSHLVSINLMLSDSDDPAFRAFCTF